MVGSQDAKRVMFGTARSEAELRLLLPKALAANRHATAALEPIAFVDLDGRSAARIADAVLAQAEEIRSGEARAASPHSSCGKTSPEPAGNAKVVVGSSMSLSTRVAVAENSAPS